MIEINDWPPQKMLSIHELATKADRDESGIVLEITLDRLRVARKDGDIFVPLHEAQRWLHGLPMSPDGSDDHAAYSAVGSDI